MSNRSKHVWKQPFEKSNYQDRLSNTFSEPTIEDNSTELTNTSTISDKTSKIDKQRKRPVSNSKKAKNFFKDYWVIIFFTSLFIGGVWWLITNDFWFQKDISNININLDNLKENTEKDINKVSDEVGKNTNDINELSKDNIYLKTNLDNLKEKSNSNLWN